MLFEKCHDQLAAIGGTRESDRSRSTGRQQDGAVDTHISDEVDRYVRLRTRLLKPTDIVKCSDFWAVLSIVPRELRRILEDETVLKLGVGIRGAYLRTTTPPGDLLIQNFRG